MARGDDFSSCHKLWTSADCISSGKILRKGGFFRRIFLKLCSSVFLFLLSISFFKSGVFPVLKKVMLFLFGNSPAGHGFYDPAGVLPLLFSFLNTLFYSQHVLKLPCTGMLSYILRRAS
jgi:hypothetical protein